MMDHSFCSVPEDHALSTSSFAIDDPHATSFPCKHCCSRPIAPEDKCEPQPVCPHIGIPHKVSILSSWRSWGSYLPFAAAVAGGGVVLTACWRSVKRRANQKPSAWDKESSSESDDSPRARAGR